jgi:hypothetical protein
VAHASGDQDRDRQRRDVLAQALMQVGSGCAKSTPQGRQLCGFFVDVSNVSSSWKQSATNVRTTAAAIATGSAKESQIPRLKP